ARSAAAASTATACPPAAGPSADARRGRRAKFRPGRLPWAQSNLPGLTQPVENRQPLLLEPFALVERGQIAEPRVAQDRDHALAWAKLFAERNGSGHVDSRGQDQAQPLFSQQPGNPIEPF